MKQLKQVFLLGCLLLSNASIAQVKVGDNPTTIDPSAVLEIESTTKGMLTPRMTEAQRTAIASPATGLTVYQTDATAGFYYYNGTAWEKLSSIDGIRRMTTAERDALTPTPGTIIYNTSFGGLQIYSGFSQSEAWVNIGTSTLSIANTHAFASGVAGINFNRFNGSGFSSVGPYTPIANGWRIGSISFTGVDAAGSMTSGSRMETVVEGTVRTKSVPVSVRFDITNDGETIRRTMLSMKSNTSNVGVNTNTPNASAILDVTSTTKGFLPPRMTNSQMGLIPKPSEGLMVYCTNCTPKGLRVYNGSNWADMVGNVPSPATFTFTGNYYHVPNFFQGRVMNEENLLYLEVDVTSVGQITISSNTVNGYSFSSNPETTNPGTQYIAVRALGIQTNYNALGDNFTITGVGTSNQNTPVTINNATTGNTFTSYSNGGTLNENFSSNSTCVDAPISAGHNSTSCSGSITVGSNSYNVVLINGQCWMQSNFREAPTAPCSAAINTGCNIWLNANVGDIGSWGHYNSATANGTAGWNTTPLSVSEGLLYQWSAAMNGETAERSKGICPIGWHIPSDCEFMYLEHGQGLSIALQQTSDIFRSTTGEGHKLRGTGGSFTNSSGFTGLLPGRRVGTSGVFSNRLANGWIWSSTPSGNDMLSRSLASSQAGVFRSTATKSTAYSVRCIKD